MREKPAEEGGDKGAQDSERQNEIGRRSQLRKMARPCNDFNNRGQENECDRKVNGQKMEAANELRPVRTLDSVMREKRSKPTNRKIDASVSAPIQSRRDHRRAENIMKAYNAYDGINDGSQDGNRRIQSRQDLGHDPRRLYAG